MGLGCVSAVVLCGGRSRRMGGVDKTAERLGSGTVLDHLLKGLPQAWPVVCVGAARPTARPVAWTRESPPGGGPVAGMAAGLAGVSTPLVVVLGGDMPFAAAAAVALSSHPRLAADPSAPGQPPRAGALDQPLDGVVATDGEGRTQPLLAAYRRAPLLAAIPPDPAGASLMRVLDRLRLEPVPQEDLACLDVDTPDALARARHIVGA